MVYFDLVKTRLEIMLGDFAEKKETFLTIKNRIIQTQKNRIFLQRGQLMLLAMVLDEKCQLLGLFRFGENKTRNNA